MTSWLINYDFSSPGEQLKPQTNGDLSCDVTSVSGDDEHKDITPSITAISCSSNDVCLAADPNSECANAPGLTVNGYCACKQGYIENESWVCTLKVLNSSCSSDSDCQEIPLAVCNQNGTCACAPGYGDYNNNDVCEKVLERPCVADGGCTMFLNHTTCFSIIGVYECSCKDEYIEEDHVCKTALGETCSSNKDCLNHGKCQPGSDKCACAPGYVSMGGHCVSGSTRLQYSIICWGPALAVLTLVKHFV